MGFNLNLCRCRFNIPCPSFNRLTSSQTRHLNCAISTPSSHSFHLNHVIATESFHSRHLNHVIATESSHSRHLNHVIATESSQPRHHNHVFSTTSLQPSHLIRFIAKVSSPSRHRNRVISSASPQPRHLSRTSIKSSASEKTPQLPPWRSGAGGVRFQFPYPSRGNRRGSRYRQTVYADCENRRSVMSQSRCQGMGQKQRRRR